MTEAGFLIESPIGVLAVLAAVAALFFFIAESTGARFFQYVPPLLFIYATPVLLSNVDFVPGPAQGFVIPSKSPVYSSLSSYLLPAFIVLMLIKVDIPAVVRVMGKGVLVMLMGTAGVIVGAVVAYFIVHPWLPEGAWKGYGALAGSWIGGTANMAASAEILGTSGEQFGLAVIADNVVYIVWLPLLLASRDFADRFNRWARVPPDRISAMEQAAEVHAGEERPPAMTEYLYLLAIVIGVTAFGHACAPVIAGWIAENAAGAATMFSESTVRILLVTTTALLLSATPVSRLPNSTALGTALVYVFVAGMGARADVSGLADAPAFVLGAFI